MNRLEWHLKSKAEMHFHVWGVCSECGKKCSKSEGCIHHNTYQHIGGIYNASWKELLSLGKIRWVCHECHLKIHQTESIDGITTVLNSIGGTLPECEKCGEEIYTADKTITTCDICNCQ